MKTLVIVSHPYPEKSTVIAALQKTAENTNDITVRNLETLYGNDIKKIDVQYEQKAYENMDRIVFLFPIHWFNLTPMLKTYLNEVWSYGWAFGPGQMALKDKEMLVTVTAGANSHTYSHEGLINSTIEEVLTPMKACALYVGMKYLKPLTFLGVGEIDETKLSCYQDLFSERLNQK